jgi:hypothetical protein
MSLLLIGDCHGRLFQYEEIIKYLEGDGVRSILLGELGFKPEHEWFIKSPYSKNNKILFGNHDYFPNLYESYSLGRYSYNPEYKMFCIAGGYSIDKQYRVEGKTWFKEEEMTSREERGCLLAYQKAKPEIVISHEAPELAINKLFNYSYVFPGGSATYKFFDVLLAYHRPRVWVFAHHHDRRDAVIKGTRFICLDELETIDVNKL